MARYAFGLFKVAMPDWVDLTGDGNPGISLPSRPLFGLGPKSAVLLEPGGPLYFVGEEVLFADTGSGFAPITAIGRTRATCSC